MAGEEPDLEFEAAPASERPEASSHLRSREEYVRGLRATWEQWLPDIPLPAEWRDPRPEPPNPRPGSNNSTDASVGETQRPPAARTHYRVQPHRAPHAFSSRPPIHRQAPTGHAIGVGYLLLTLRELAGLSQRKLARLGGTSQGAITRVETGAHTPSLPSLIRLANAAGFRLVLGLASPDLAEADPALLEIEDFALVGLVLPDPLDGLPNFRVIREPPPWAGSA